jgi:hypothetical protein
VGEVLEVLSTHHPHPNYAVPHHRRRHGCLSPSHLRLSERIWMGFRLSSDK